MGQLIMRWIPEKISEPEFPEGYRFHRWKRGGDDVLTEEQFRTQWIGMRDPSFGEAMTNYFHVVYDDMRVPDDGFFLAISPGGDMAACICIQYGQHDPDSATVHEVFTDEKYRGLGLGRVLMTKLMNHAAEKGFPELWLTTDDWRIPAIKLYIHLGFLPVLSEPDLRMRWQALLDEIGETEIKVIDEDGKYAVLKK